MVYSDIRFDYLSHFFFSDLNSKDIDELPEALIGKVALLPELLKVSSESL